MCWWAAAAAGVDNSQARASLAEDVLAFYRVLLKAKTRFLAGYAC